MKAYPFCFLFQKSSYQCISRKPLDRPGSFRTIWGKRMDRRGHPPAEAHSTVSTAKAEIPRRESDSPPWRRIEDAFPLAAVRCPLSFSGSNSPRSQIFAPSAFFPFPRSLLSLILPQRLSESKDKSRPPSPREAARDSEDSSPCSANSLGLLRGCS